MARLTIRAALAQLSALGTGGDAARRCCVCHREPLAKEDEIRIEFTRGRYWYPYRFAICSARCAYELGKRTMPAIVLLTKPPRVRAVSADAAAVRGAGRRTRTHAGGATGVRRKNATRAAK